MNDNHHIDIVFNHADSVPKENVSHSSQYLIINAAGDYDLVRGTFSTSHFISFLRCNSDQCTELKPYEYKLWANLPAPPSKKCIPNSVND